MKFKINWFSIALLGLLFMTFMFYLFPKQHDKINEIAGKELVTLDGRFSYSDGDVVNLFSDMGEEGREVYIFTTSVIDMIYPIIYMLFLLFIFIKFNITNNLAFRLFYPIPVLAMIFDYLENFGTLKLLASYPDIISEHVELNSLFTSAKWICVMQSIILIIVLIILNAFKYFKKGGN